MSAVSPSSAKTPSASIIAIGRLLLIALCLTLLSACSGKTGRMRTPALQANLAAHCPEIPAIPIPFIDPARAVWERNLIAMYGDCGSRHRHTVDAWPKSEK